MDIQNLVATNFTILKEEQLMKKTKSMMKKITYLMTMLMTGFCMLLQVFAAEEESTTSDYDFSWLTKGEGNQSFSKMTSMVQDTGASFYLLMMAVGVFGLAGVGTFVGLRLASAGAGKRAEALEQMLMLIIGGSVIFGIPAIIGLAKSIGGNF